MSSTEREVCKIEQIPDERSFGNILYHNYVRLKIERGLKDIEEGRLLSQEEVEHRMSKWFGR